MYTRRYCQSRMQDRKKTFAYKLLHECSNCGKLLPALSVKSVTGTCVTAKGVAWARKPRYWWQLTRQLRGYVTPEEAQFASRRWSWIWSPQMNIRHWLKKKVWGAYGLSIAQVLEGWLFVVWWLRSAWNALIASRFPPDRVADHPTKRNADKVPAALLYILAVRWFALWWSCCRCLLTFCCWREKRVCPPPHFSEVTWSFSLMTDVFFFQLFSSSSNRIFFSSSMQRP